MEYTLIRSKRKTIAIHIVDGAVEVRAPLNAAKRDIDRFVNSKGNWIRENLKASIELAERRKAFTLGYGDKVRYRGKTYPIAAKKGDRVGFDDTVFYMPPDLPEEHIRSACVQIYRLLARRDLTIKTLELAKRMNVQPYNVKITGATTRWGSCSSKRSINFSWRLILADDELIDYVVVHELAHLTEMNHSPRFWAIVEGVLPDYRERIARIHDFQRQIMDEDW